MGDSDGENIGLSEGINSKDAGKNYPKEIEAKILELKKGKRAKKTATTKVRHVLEKLCAVQSEENVGEIEKNIEVLWELLEVTLSTIDELNKSRKSFVAKLGDGKCGFLGVRGPQKSWRNNFRVRVRALTVMTLNLMSEPGFPVPPW